MTVTSLACRQRSSSDKNDKPGLGELRPENLIQSLLISYTLEHAKPGGCLRGTNVCYCPDLPNADTTNHQRPKLKNSCKKNEIFTEGLVVETVKLGDLLVFILLACAWDGKGTSERKRRSMNMASTNSFGKWVYAKEKHSYVVHSATGLCGEKPFLHELPHCVSWLCYQTWPQEG